MYRTIEEEIVELKKRQQEIREQLRNLQDEYEYNEVRIVALERDLNF